MDKIEESVEMLLQVIRGSEVYMDYKKQEEKIMANPELCLLYTSDAADEL